MSIALPIRFATQRVTTLDYGDRLSSRYLVMVCFNEAQGPEGNLAWQAWDGKWHLSGHEATQAAKLGIILAAKHSDAFALQSSLIASLPTELIDINPQGSI